MISTAVMSYISIATGIGPWIDTTLVLLGTIIFRLWAGRRTSATATNQAIGLSVAAGSIGGIAATGCGFAFPTLFFLDPALFNSWMASPFYFIAILMGLVLAAGSFGLIIAQVFEQRLLKDPEMPFPIGELVQKMIVAQNQVKKSIELALGIVTASCISMLQIFSSTIPQTVTVLPRIMVGVLDISPIALRLDLFPMLWAIGFVTGHVLAIPLGVGVISKIFFLEPINKIIFPALRSEAFISSFLNGMVLQGAIMSLFDLPKMITSAIKRMKKGTEESHESFVQLLSKSVSLIEALGVFVAIIFLLYWFNFSWFAQLYLVIFTFICTYQLLIIAGKIGLAQMGRFATFVLLPGLLIFGFNGVQATILSTFIEVCGGVAVDSMFGRKMGQLIHIDRKKIVIFQWLGLLVSSLVIGVVFWLLIDRFGLGSHELIAQRAQARALLIHINSFDYYVAILGALFGFLLKFLHISPMLVLGALVMPIDFSLVLICSGLSTYLVHDKETQYPFWSGVFAASSLWMLCKAFM